MANVPRSPPKPKLSLAAVTLATLALASLAGCVADADDASTIRQDGSSDMTPAAVGKEDVRFEWQGEFHADGFLCPAGGCVELAAIDDKPHNHVRWYEVTLDGLPADAVLALTWKVRSGTAPEMQFKLECFQSTEARCPSYDVPTTQGKTAPLNLDVPKLSTKSDDVLQVYVGVVPVSTPKGDYYPAVDVTFQATATFGLR